MSAPISKQQLNEAVRRLAAKSRPEAVAILAKFGVPNTVKLPQDQWQAVYDECTEALKKFGGAPQ